MPRFKYANRERGLRTYADFRASYGENVRLQTSSSAEGPHVWIFIEDKNGDEHDSAHMSAKQATKLRDAINRWLEDYTD